MRQYSSGLLKCLATATSDLKLLSQTCFLSSNMASSWLHAEPDRINQLVSDQRLTHVNPRTNVSACMPDVFIYRRLNESLLLLFPATPQTRGKIAEREATRILNNTRSHVRRLRQLSGKWGCTTCSQKFQSHMTRCLTPKSINPSQEIVDGLDLNISIIRFTR